MTVVALAVASSVASVSLAVVPPAIEGLPLPAQEVPTSTELVLIRSRLLTEQRLIFELRARQRSGGGRARGVSALSSRRLTPTSVYGNVLERIARCESGGSYTAENPHSTASGRYQVLKGTWGKFGGYAEAKDAPPAVQEEHARQLFARSGSTPWNASRRCWG